MKITSRVALSIVIIGTVALALIPILQTQKMGTYRGVVPSYVDDDLYYYGRMKEVADGEPFLGNPYFLEHRDAGSVAFSVTDWMAAVPLVAGIPFTSAIIINFIFWSAVLSVLMYVVLRRCDLSPPWAATISLLAYAEVYWLVLRPVIMQQVFPFFILFTIAFLVWHREPLRHRSIILLIAACASAFYVYSYLWQIIFFALVSTFLHRVLRKRWPEVKALVWVAFGTAVAALPMLVAMVRQLGDALYWETFARIGLVATRLPSLDAYRYGRWAVLLVLIGVLYKRWLGLPKTEIARRRYSVIDVLNYVGLGLVVAAVSNVITGIDLSTGQHVGRFVTLYIALFFPVVLLYAWQQKSEIRQLSRWRLMILALLALPVIGFLGMNLKRSLPFQEIAKTDIASIQEYAAPLGWLEARESAPVVIWSDDAISSYIPILTKHYVLWNKWGNLHMMTTKEAEDRYLASRIDALTLKDGVVALNGAEGEAISRKFSDAYNTNALSCFFGMHCRRAMSLEQWYDGSVVGRLLQRQADLRKDMRNVLITYHVAYLLADTTLQEDLYFKKLPGASEVWHDNRFIIYAVK